jgi:glycosyltransferase involved in cell wall biosynthesis
MAKILYISYDGMTDPLGQAQVIPYVTGLSKKGFHFVILSAEKSANYNEFVNPIGKLLKEHNIFWYPVSYTKNPPIISTIVDIFRMARRAVALHKQEHFDIVHCRSYITALIGLWMKRRYGIKFIFDMRGFWADERVEGGLWNMRNPVYYIIYHYFKRKEKHFLSNADYVISLTYKAKDEIEEFKLKTPPKNIEVIPCCADLQHFSQENIDYNFREEFKKVNGITDDDFVISYLGALGTWYLLYEMMLFFKCLLREKPNAKFLFITTEQPGQIYENAGKLGIDKNLLIITKAARAQVPALLSLSKVSIFFIKPGFSKKATSPTKAGEMMAMGIPIICNDKIGDMEKIIKETQAGMLVRRFTEEEFKGIISHLNLQPDASVRESAQRYFSLDSGVKKYYSVYNKLLEG